MTPQDLLDEGVPFIVDHPGRHETDGMFVPATDAGRVEVAGATFPVAAV